MMRKILCAILAFGMLFNSSMAIMAEDAENTAENESVTEAVTEESTPEIDLLKGLKQENFSAAGEVVTSKIEFDKDKYINITTDGIDCFGNADSFHFLYAEETTNPETYNKTVVTSTVCDVSGSEGLSAASGPMMRAKLTNDSPHVLVRVRQNKQIIFSWRLTDAYPCKYIVGPTVDMPVKLRLEREGNLYTAFYKPVTAEESAWIEIGSVEADLGDKIYNGISTFAIKQETPVTASVRRIIVKNYMPGQKSDETAAELKAERQDDEEILADFAEKLRLEQEKQEALKAYYLIENFEDQSLTVGVESIENPKWLSSEAVPVFEKDEDGTTWWVRNKVGTFAYVGKPTWADYKMSFDFVIDPETAGKVFTIHVRTRPDVIKQRSIWPCYYSINFMGTSLYLEKSVPFRNGGGAYRKSGATIPELADGKKHTMVIEAFDNNLKLYIDGKLSFIYTDDTAFPHTRGMIGFSTANVNIKISNLIVEKMEDELGGVYDNYLLTGFNEPTMEIYERMIKIGE